jgi:hypothetical protein
MGIKPNGTVFDSPTLLKKPYQKLDLTPEQEQEFIKCAIDPLYFIDNYVYVQHATKGKINLHLYDYQREMVTDYWKNRYVIAMASRQLGKSSTSNTIITCNDKKVKISSLIKLSFKEKIVTWLENILIKLSTM